MSRKSLSLAIALAGVASPALAVVTISYEAAGLTNTTKPGLFAVEDFNDEAAGYQSFDETIDGVNFAYNNVYVRAGDQFGGDGGSTYGAAYSGVGINPASPYTLTFSTLQSYFGLYISAADNAPNASTLTFSNGDTYSTSHFFANNDASPYTVNGLTSFFVNLKTSSAFNSVTFTPANGTGFESDNHTIAVPEAATWAMMVIGFGAMGAAMRRRRPVQFGI